jgi:hypothetical protein
LNIDILAEGDKIEKLNEIWVKVKKNNRDILTAEEEQKIKYQKTAEFFGKRLAKLK